ncbi:MAG: RloB family protein [Candidatus Omnitrophica bacterium]|nr:RloB family protein [Candidatus Omnitrophota bacterium]
MGSDALFWKNKARLKRKEEKRAERENILIVCEGEKTEPNYFKAFHVTSANIKVLGKGFNTKSLVKDTEKINEKARINGEPYDQVWCVFDRDSFTKEQFNTAIQMAEKYGFHAAYSNEAFELWYILHSEYFTARLNRKAYQVKLTKFLGAKYKKNDTLMYSKLLSKQKKAIRNAKKLLKQYSSTRLADNKPSTTVHLLVEVLNKYIR